MLTLFMGIGVVVIDVWWELLLKLLAEKLFAFETKISVANWIEFGIELVFISCSSLSFMLLDKVGGLNFFILIILLIASIIKTIETSEAKQSSVKRVIYLTRKLRLNTTIKNKKRLVQMPIHVLISKKSKPYLLSIFIFWFRINFLTIKFLYLHASFIKFSRISTGPVAVIIIKGWPEKSENINAQIEPAKIHSIVAYFFFKWK